VKYHLGGLIDMGSYEREKKAIAEGTATRGQAARAYFAKIDAGLTEEESALTHRPDYSKTLFAEKNDDIYREFCHYIDQPEPRYFDKIEDPIKIEGYTAADVYRIMKASATRVLDVDAAAVYNMMVKLREQPEIAKRVLDFKPTCYQGGCGMYDGAYTKGLYDWQKQAAE
jgi:hypothetical protein